jgi:uncharacterized membrane protein YkvA (DUF1232 family)
MSKTSPSSDLRQTTGFLGNLIQQARLAWRLFRDGRVPGWVKLIPVAGLLYLLSPIDLIPDLALPGLGELDDLALLMLSLKMFIDLSPSGLVREHLENLSGVRRGTFPSGEPSPGQTIEATYRVLDENEARRRPG